MLGTVYICQDPQNIHQQEWASTQAMDFNISASIPADVQLTSARCYGSENQGVVVSL